MKISIFKSAATTGKELSIITGPWSCPAVLKKIELSNNFFGYRRKGYTEFTTGTVRQLSPAAITRSNSPTVVFTSAGTGSKGFTTAMEVLLSLANSARSNAKTMPIT